MRGEPPSRPPGGLNSDGGPPPAQPHLYPPRARRRVVLRSAVALFLQLVVLQSVEASDRPTIPDGATRLGFENLEGLVLVEAHLHGAGRDTSGLFALDTGAGYLALDHPLAYILGVSATAEPQGGVAVADHALARLGLGSLRIDYVTPLLTIDAGIVRRFTDRPVLGLLGQRPFTGRALIVDYAAEQLTVLPVPQMGERSLEASRRVLDGHLSDSARAISFELAGDGKILVRGGIPAADSSAALGELTWIVDTGATRCVLFQDAFDDGRFHRGWRAMEGLRAPTLLGDEPGRLALVPQIALHAPGGDVVEDAVETLIIGGPLARSLALVVGERVHGLIGYSFLGRFRVAIDYVNRALWLDPLPEGWEGRPWRDSQIGLQLERRAGAITVAGVVRDSPAEDAGIRIGDRLVTLGGTPSRLLDVPGALRRLEGRPGTSITLTFERDRRLMTHKLLRRRLL